MELGCEPDFEEPEDDGVYEDTTVVCSVWRVPDLSDSEGLDGIDVTITGISSR